MIKNRETIKNIIVDLLNKSYDYVKESDSLDFTSDITLYLLMDSISSFGCLEHYDLKPDLFVTVNYWLGMKLADSDEKPVGIILSENHPKYDRINDENNTINLETSELFADWMLGEFAEMNEDEYEKLTTKEATDEELGIWV